MTRLEEIKKHLEKGWTINIDASRWLVEQIEKLTEQNREHRKYIEEQGVKYSELCSDYNAKSIALVRLKRSQSTSEQEVTTDKVD